MIETRGRKPTLCPDDGKLRELVSGGAALSGLVEHFGIGPNAVRRWLRERGLTASKYKGNIYTSRHRIWRETSSQDKIDAMFPAPQRERFWALVGRATDHECWPWNGGRSKIGYGQHSVRGMHHRAHRVAYMLSKGPIPADLHVLHKCDNRACCNPKHLEAGTVQQNNAHRDAQLKCTKGERHHSARLKEPQVLEILASNERPCVLAKRYGVYHSAIQDIRRGITWKHLTRATRE